MEDGWHTRKTRCLDRKIIILSPVLVCVLVVFPWPRIVGLICSLTSLTSPAQAVWLMHSARDIHCWRCKTKVEPKPLPATKTSKRKHPYILHPASRLEPVPPIVRLTSPSSARYPHHSALPAIPYHIMAPKALVPLLVTMMLVTGVCNTLLTKYQVCTSL